MKTKTIPTQFDTFDSLCIQKFEKFFIMKSVRIATLLLTVISPCLAFTGLSTPLGSIATSLDSTCDMSSTALKMANNDDLLRWARSARGASAEDRVIELKRPLGIVLNEDDSGNVYVETVAPKGNAARTGDVSENLVTNGALNM